MGNKTADHSDVVGASPVRAAPTTSSFSTWHLASIDCTETTARWDERHLSFVIWCNLYSRFYGRPPPMKSTGTKSANELQRRDHMAGYQDSSPSNGGQVMGYFKSTVETLYNTINFCSSTHKRHSIARPKGRGMGCLLWVQRAIYCVDLSKLSSIKYLL